MSWQSYQASVTGPAHRQEGCNQDAATWFECPDGTWIGAVADGAGSLELSHLGSQLAVKASVEAGSKAREGGGSLLECVQAGVQAAGQALRQHPDKEKVGATLVLAMAGGEGWALGLVGDSLAVLSFDGESHQAYTSEPAGEYVNITRLLTSKDPQAQFHCGSESLTGITLMSDGMTSSALQKDDAHSGFFTPLISQAKAGTLNLDELLAHMETLGRIHDDTTILVTSWQD